MIANAKATENTPPLNARWIVDNMAIMRVVKPKKTYKQWLGSVMRYNTPPASSKPLSLEMVNDTYRQLSAKNGTRISRGEESRKVHFTGMEQNMLQGKEWMDIFHNISNKQDLISLFTSYLKNESIDLSQNMPVFFTNKDETWRVSQNALSRLPDCNHEEADTKMLVHALREDTDVVIVARDTDVLILMVYVYAKHHVKRNWYMKYAAGKYANIGKIVAHLGVVVSLKLPHIHAITGCDTTSYFHGVGKMRVLNKCLKQPHLLSLLSNLGSSSGEPSRYKDIERFINTVCYSGHIGETVVETRVRLYKRQKVKTSQSIPPDPDSMKQAILRINHQLYYWVRCNINMTETIPLEDNGWIVAEDSVIPVWFTGEPYKLL